MERDVAPPRASRYATNFISATGFGPDTAPSGRQRPPTNIRIEHARQEVKNTPRTSQHRHQKRRERRRDVQEEEHVEREERRHLDRRIARAGEELRKIPPIWEAPRLLPLLLRGGCLVLAFFASACVAAAAASATVASVGCLLGTSLVAGVRDGSEWWPGLRGLPQTCVLCLSRCRVRVTPQNARPGASQSVVVQTLRGVHEGPPPTEAIGTVLRWAGLRRDTPVQPRLLTDFTIPVDCAATHVVSRAAVNRDSAGLRRHSPAALDAASLPPTRTTPVLRPPAFTTVVMPTYIHSTPVSTPLHT